MLSTIISHQLDLDSLMTSQSYAIFKQGDRSDMNNYRPISVISAIAKVFERTIYSQLSSYLSENNIFSHYQSGFRSFHSTMTALLEATDNWAFNIDRGYVNAVVFIDLKKTFDTVNHPILLSNLYLYRKCLRIAFFLLRQSHAKMCCQWCHF